MSAATPASLQRLDLVLHQRHAAARRRPVSPPFTSAGTWKHSDLPEPVGITQSTLRPGQHGIDGRFLPGAERVVAEDSP